MRELPRVWVEACNNPQPPKGGKGKGNGGKGVTLLPRGGGGSDEAPGMR